MLMNNQYFQELIGCSIADFLAPFIGADDPIDEAICSLLYKMQSNGSAVPQGFTTEARRYIVEARTAEYLASLPEGGAVAMLAEVRSQLRAIGN